MDGEENTVVPQSSTVNDTNPRTTTELPNDSSELQGEIEADVQALLAEMHTSFKVFTETVFSKIDCMTEKIQALEKSIDILSVPEEVVGNDSVSGKSHDITAVVDEERELRAP